MKTLMNTNFKRKAILCLSILSLSFLVSCSNDDDAPSGEEESLVIPTVYNVEDGEFAPGIYSGQVTRIAQLNAIKDVLRDTPINFDLGDAIADGNNPLFTDLGLSDTNLRTKMDELSFDEGNTSVADDFDTLADLLVALSENGTATVAVNGTEGYLDGRWFNDNGLEYAQILEKGIYGAVLYDQMVDDYMRDVQAGADNANGNNQATVDNYATHGTDRQHRWDEAFGYFGADPLTYPNVANTSNGDGDFIANYTFDRSDDYEAAFGINLAEEAMKAFITGRAVLKAGEGLTVDDESTDEALFDTARADVKSYVESGLAATAYHYLNSSISDIEQVTLNAEGAEADKLHHLSEAFAFIYSLSFNSEGKISLSQVQAVLAELGWTTTLDADSGMILMDGLYDVNLWDITEEQLEAAKTALDVAFPGYGDIAF